MEVQVHRKTPYMIKAYLAAMIELGGAKALDEWNPNGSIIVPDLFSWLWKGTPTEEGWEDGIWPQIGMGFDMYLHHRRKRNGENNSD